VTKNKLVPALLFVLLVVGSSSSLLAGDGPVSCTGTAECLHAG
jgi:hypothetical protein